MSKWTVEANADTIATIELYHPVQFWPERTCKYIWDADRHVWFCSECGGLEPCSDSVNYCCDCGAKVVGNVE